MRDNETGLVWMRDMGSVIRDTWNGAISGCRAEDLGDVRGWRLPSESELMSIMDPAPYNPALPPGSPFIVPASFVSLTWWTSTQVPDSPTVGYSVRSKGQYLLSPGVLAEAKSNPACIMRVRGAGRRSKRHPRLGSAARNRCDADIVCISQCRLAAD